MNSARRKTLLWSALGVAAVIYLLTGLYTIESGQNALILRFGKLVSVAVNPGVNYHLPAPFETAVKIRVRQVQKVMIQTDKGKGVETFTGDENLILVQAVVGYDLKSPEAYLFSVSDPEALIAAAAQTCLNREVARLSVDEVMTTGKSILRLALKRKIQETLDELSAGVRVISVELTDISPPLNVSNAFKAVSDAREKKQRIVKEAEGYANTIVPKARGEVSSIVSGAEAYAGETVNLAHARAQAFEALYAEYRKDPEITAKVKYLETVRKIYRRCGVIIDSDPSQSIYYVGKEGKVKKDSAKVKGKGEGGY